MWFHVTQENNYMLLFLENIINFLNIDIKMLVIIKIKELYFLVSLSI